MSRSTKLLLGLFVLLALATYFFLPSGEERMASYKLPEFGISVDSASVVKIEIQRPEKSFTLENIGGAWKITSVGTYAADTRSIAQVIGSVAKLKARSLVSSNPEKQTLFQVGPAGTKLTLTDRSGKSLAIVIGKSGPSFSEVYLRLEGSNDVYLAEGLDTWVINQELKDWRDKTILSAVADSINQITIAQKNRSFVLRRDSTTWLLGKDTIAANIISSTLNTLTNLRADDFVDTLFQSRTSPTSVKVHTGDEITLRFYPLPPDSSKYFVQTSRSPQVYVVNKWTVQEILKPIEKYRK